MGFFSWKTSDTKRSISNKWSNRKTFKVYMVLPNLTEKEVSNAAGYEYVEIDKSLRLDPEIPALARVRHTPKISPNSTSDCCVVVEDNYDGYGIFGGVCFGAVLFELNKSKYTKEEIDKIKTLEDKRSEGHKILTMARCRNEAGMNGYKKMMLNGWVFPLLIENKKTMLSFLNKEKNYEEFDPCYDCPNQGYFY